MNDSMTEGRRTQDAYLLQLFAEQGDEAAFAELVRRHRGTVMSVCRRILGNTQDAEDAFQAVFVALAKHAPKLTGHPALGAWLHRVACGTALDAVRRRTTREKKEREASTMQEEIAEPSQVTEETGALLHAELNALPERYRRPLILFHIEERSLEETGRQLNVPVNTVSTWLRRGREKLRARLLRRGVAVSVAGLGAILSAETASAGVAEGLVVSTAQLAAVAAGKAAAAAGCGMSANVAAMTKGAMKMIFMAKLKVACLVGSGVVLVTATTVVVAEKTVEAQRAVEENKAGLAQVRREKWVAPDPAAGAEEEGPLGIAVRAEKPAFGTDERLRFAVTFTNRSAQAVLLHVVDHLGSQTSGRYAARFRNRAGGESWTVRLNTRAPMADAPARLRQEPLAAGGATTLTYAPFGEFVPEDAPGAAAGSPHLPPGDYDLLLSVEIADLGRAMTAAPSPFTVAIAAASPLAGAAAGTVVRQAREALARRLARQAEAEKDPASGIALPGGRRYSSFRPEDFTAEVEERGQAAIVRFSADLGADQALTWTVAVTDRGADPNSAMQGFVVVSRRRPPVRPIAPAPLAPGGSRPR